ncbi:MAG: OmpA family protein [Candidatus Krumholzibacteriia bacterium]
MASNRAVLSVVRNAALLVLAAGLVVLAGCSCKEYEEQIMQLDQQIATLQQQITERETTVAECEEVAAELRENLRAVREENAALVEQTEEVVYVTLDEKLTFGDSQTMILDTMEPTLRAVAETIRNRPDWEVFVAGYTDERKILEEFQDRFPSNWELGAHRAAAVVRYLTNQFDLPAERFGVVSFGPFRPITEPVDDAARAQNRVVRIFLHKATGI